MTGVISTSAFDWSPDGSVLLFAERHGVQTRLVGVTVRDLAVHVLGGTGDYIDMVRWSPNTDYVACHTQGGPGKQHRLVIERVADGRRLDVVEGSLQSSLEWSPDSRRLAAAVSQGGTRTEVRVWQLEGTTVRELCRLPGVALWWDDPVWSSDGERIMVRERDGAPGILGVRDGQPVYQPADTWKAASASPDLRYLIGVAADGVVVADVQTGERHSVVLGKPLGVLPDWSALQGPVWFGGSTAFALSHAGLLWVVDAATGRGRSIGPQQWPGYPRLERGRLAGGVAYHQGTENPVLNGLYWLRRPTEEPARILDDPTTGGIATVGGEWEWSPDGKWGTYGISTPVDPRDASKGSLDWQLLLRVRDGKVYHLAVEGWTPKPLRRLVWSPARSEALVWSDQGASLLTFPE